MPGSKMQIWDKRMFELMDFVIANKLKGVDSTKKFIDIVEIATQSTLNQVRDGRQSFRQVNFHKACKLFGVSMDWFFGFTDEMKRGNKNNTAEELLMQALVKLRTKKKS